MVNFREEFDGREGFRLSEEADRLLREAGLDIWGRKKTKENYFQSRFEDSAMTGAYSRNSERNRKRQ